jgi:hypothetical protein
MIVEGCNDVSSFSSLFFFSFHQTTNNAYIKQKRKYFSR